MKNNARGAGMNQYQIEQLAGIKSPELAKHIMEQKTVSAKNAMSLLVMQCQSFDRCGMALLQEAVKDCKKELSV